MQKDVLVEIAQACLERVLAAPRPSAEEVTQANLALQTLFMLRDGLPA